MDKKQALKAFYDIYGENSEHDVRIFHSPGRVNLIGEHTDYNGGNVFPCALNFGTYGIVRKRSNNRINFASTNFPRRGYCYANSDIVFSNRSKWTNYLKGVLVEFKNMGHKLEGMDILISGNIPNGSGLSSSASIEVLMGVICNELFNYKLSMIDIVKLSQHAENTFIGVNCGIMDQFAVGMGKKNHAILLDCKTLEYSYVPMEISGHKLIIANTNKKRGLQDSKYNERRTECEAAVKDLQKNGINIEFLGELSISEFEKYRHFIKDDINKLRATHAVYENQRTLQAQQALKENDLEHFGKLMNDSHDSLKNCYEVSCIELDTLVIAARKVKGTLGSRMTGAGFGGCTVSLVEENSVEAFIETVSKSYKKEIGYEPSFYIAETGDGTMEIDI